MFVKDGSPFSPIVSLHAVQDIGRDDFDEFVVAYVYCLCVNIYEFGCVACMCLCVLCAMGPNLERQAGQVKQY